MIDLIHYIFIAIIGVCLGSFASLIAYRWPRRLPWVNTRSACPACGHTLGARDLVPVLSWVMSGAKCRYCAVKISARYPLLEITTAVISLGIYMLIGWRWELIPALALVPIALSLTLIFFDARRNPKS